MSFHEQPPIYQFDYLRQSWRKSVIELGLIAMLLIGCVPIQDQPELDGAPLIGQSWPLTLSPTDETVLSTWQTKADLGILWRENGRLMFWRSTAPPLHIETAAPPIEADLLYTTDGLWHLLYTTDKGVFYQAVNKHPHKEQRIQPQGKDPILHHWQQQLSVILNQNGRYTMYLAQPSQTWDPIWNIGAGDALQVVTDIQGSYLLLSSAGTQTLFGRTAQEEQWDQIGQNLPHIDRQHSDLTLTAQNEKLVVTWVTQENAQNRPLSDLRMIVSNTGGRHWSQPMTVASQIGREQIKSAHSSKLINTGLLIVYMIEKKGDVSGGRLGYRRLFWLTCSLEGVCQSAQPLFQAGRERPVSQAWLAETDQTAEQTFVIWGAYQSSYAQNRDWFITLIGGDHTS